MLETKALGLKKGTTFEVAKVIYFLYGYKCSWIQMVQKNGGDLHLFTSSLELDFSHLSYWVSVDPDTI